MFKYSIAAVALLASSSLASADMPNRGVTALGVPNPEGTERGPNAAAGKSALPGTVNDRDTPRADGRADRRSENSDRFKSNGESDRATPNTGARSGDNGPDPSMKTDRFGDHPDQSKAGQTKEGQAAEPSRYDSGRKGETDERADTRAGQPAAKSSLTAVSPEQETRVKAVFKEQRVEPARINVAVNVGVAIPRSVHLYPVPSEIVAIVPAYRDYEYILLDDNRVAIVDPATFEVVDIILIA